MRGANIPKGKPHLSNHVSREGKIEFVLSKQNLIWIIGFEGCNGGTEKLDSQMYKVTSHKQLDTNISNFIMKKAIYSLLFRFAYLGN